MYRNLGNTVRTTGSYLCKIYVKSVEKYVTYSKGSAIAYRLVVRGRHIQKCLRRALFGTKFKFDVRAKGSKQWKSLACFLVFLGPE